MAALALILSAAPAWAHGEFRPDRVARGTTAELDLVLPSERPSARTAKVVLAMPTGFTVTSCEEPVGWTCAVAADAVEWRDVARIRAEVDFFFSVEVSDVAGTYTLPVEQSYDDGTVNTFAGPPGSPDEAPVLTVTGAGPAPTAARPLPARTTPPPAPSTSRPSATPRAITTARPPGSGSTAPSSPSSPSSPASSAVTPTAALAVESSSPAPFTRPQTLPRGELIGGPAQDDGTGAGLLRLLAGALVALVGVGVLTRQTGRGRGVQPTGQAGASAPD